MSKKPKFVACEGDYDKDPRVKVHSIHGGIKGACRAASKLAKHSEHVYWHALEVKSGCVEPDDIVFVEKREGRDPLVVGHREQR